MNWREGAILGTLVKTRGLMQLVNLNIGYDLWGHLRWFVRDDGTRGLGDNSDDHAAGALARAICRHAGRCLGERT